MSPDEAKPVDLGTLWGCKRGLPSGAQALSAGGSRDDPPQLQFKLLPAYDELSRAEFSPALKTEPAASSLLLG